MTLGPADAANGTVLEPLESECENDPPTLERPAPVSSPADDHRIVIIDDHIMIREGIVALLGRVSDFDVAAEVENAAAGLEVALRLQPDLIVLDLDLDGDDGIELIKNLAKVTPQAKILVLTMLEENLYAERALRAGASGYVMKHAASRDLIVALRTIMRGEIYVSPTIASRLLMRLARPGRGTGDPIADHLTDRELQIFTLLGRGTPTRHIAERLGLSVKTVEWHRENIKRKLELGSAAELLSRATEWLQASRR